jgi:hypothetical protein
LLYAPYEWAEYAFETGGFGEEVGCGYLVLRNKAAGNKVCEDESGCISSRMYGV